MRNELLLADLRENNNVNRFKARRDWKHRVEHGRQVGTAGVHAAAGSARSSSSVRSLPSVPSRNKPMPKLFFAATIAGALVWALAIFGLISIAQFLHHAGGG